ncbi:MAG TPA: hypothetical protein PLQ13_09490 [Candidatus Krumholzibacteria bacterium]|nr:hypothetical protein [Candidatus Krumholzibacteria bacterium]
MAITASVSYPAMTSLLAKVPCYEDYRSEDEAALAERIYRRALGAVLKKCGDHLLSVIERRSQILSSEQEKLISGLVDRIARIFRRLDREGIVCLVGDCAATIAELQELDTRLIMLVEEALGLVHNLGPELPANAWFKSDAGRLSHDLDSFSQMTEERNYLLGLGWESEFQWPGRSSS